MEIDVVITWVDGNDPVWQAEKAKYSGKASGDGRAKRYRDWEFLRYWFRSMEACAPWLNRIHFVTCGHLPPWLNTDHPKLHIANHRDFIPEKYLPTFSCRPIELNLHRIPGLTEHFVYFNDDMFLFQPSKAEDFFVNGLPCDTAILNASHISGVDENGNFLMPENYNSSNVLNLIPINRNFDKKQSIRRNLGKWLSPKYGAEVRRTLLLMPFSYFPGFRNMHLPYSLLRGTFEEAWQKEEYLMDRACSHRFRDSTDISSRMLSFWQIAKGEFAPRSPKIGKYYSIHNEDARNQAMYEAVRGRRHKLVCINDEYTGDDFEGVKQKLLACFEQAFPQPSAYEKDQGGKA